MGEEQKPMKIHIETSGVNSISGSYDWITLSPKRHSPPTNYFLKNCNELKFIINDKKDLDFAVEIRKKILKISKDEKKKNSNFPEKKYFLQPSWKNKDGFSFAIDFVKKNPTWNLSIQTHKYLNIK